jgi:hypothetical protein
MVVEGQDETVLKRMWRGRQRTSMTPPAGLCLRGGGHHTAGGLLEFHETAALGQT